MGNDLSQGGSVWSRLAKWVALLGFPASLTSPGATVCFALVGIYGLVLLYRRKDMPRDLRDAHHLMLGCYLLLLAVDILNGGGWSNLTATGVNYLPLVALAPFAYALRSLQIAPGMFDRAMAVAVGLAVCISFGRLLLEGERPGGLNLNPIPYGFVIAAWSVMLFSRGLATGRVFLLGLAAAGIVPVMLTESKIALVCMVTGLLILGVGWARRQGRWKLFASGLAVSGGVVVAGSYMIVGHRIRLLLEEIWILLNEGSVVAGSFGYRVELALAGWQTFMQRPLLGHGLADYMDAVRANASPGGVDISGLGHLHNDYIAHLASFGVFGLLFLVAYYAATAWLVTRSGEPAYRQAGIALLAMLAIYMVAEIGFNMDPITGCLTLAFGTVLSLPRKTSAPGYEKSTKPG